MKTFISNLALCVLTLITLNASADSGKNKKLVRDFYDLAFNQHKPKEAAEAYLSEGYVQHNPHVPTGRKAFILAFSGKSERDTSVTLFKRLISFFMAILEGPEFPDHPRRFCRHP